MTFRDRREAGRRLAAEMQHLSGRPIVVLGLPRGGVPVAYEVAKALGAPLDVIVVRKLGVPFEPELGMGAIGEDGVEIINDDIVTAAGVTPEAIAKVKAKERIELERRARSYRGDRSRIDLTGTTAVIVDDGLATGSTARAACHVARRHGAARIVLAVPVAPASWTSDLGADADEYVAVITPVSLWSIGSYYRDFSQTTDAEVVTCLDDASKGFPGTS